MEQIFRDYILEGIARINQGRDLLSPDSEFHNTTVVFCRPGFSTKVSDQSLLLAGIEPRPN